MKMLGKNQHATSVRHVFDKDLDQWVIEVTTKLRKVVKISKRCGAYKYASLNSGVVYTSLYDIPREAMVPSPFRKRAARMSMRDARKAHCMRVRRDRHAD